jgi:hypothetical protein
MVWTRGGTPKVVGRHENWLKNPSEVSETRTDAQTKFIRNNLRGTMLFDPPTKNG